MLNLEDMYMTSIALLASLSLAEAQTSLSMAATQQIYLNGILDYVSSNVLK